MYVKLCTYHLMSPALEIGRLRWLLGIQIKEKALNVGDKNYPGINKRQKTTQKYLKGGKKKLPT